MEDHANSSDSIPHWNTLFTEEELQSALKVFTVYADNEDYKQHAKTNPTIADLFKTARRALIASEDELKDRRRRRKKDRKEADSTVLAVTGIRQMRQVKMVGYLGGSVDIPMPPRIATKEANEEFAQLEDAKLKDAEGDPMMIEGAAEEAANAEAEPAAEQMPEQNATEHSENPHRPRKLNFSRACHICGKPFKILHHFYDQMCPDCAEHNFQKRFSEADMRGRVCIVTGARVKIGYCITLKFLRMGATVIATTRFPHDAANRYAREPDFESFKGRLAVYGLDFRDIPMLHHFCNHVKQVYKRLDVIINNAAQTVRKPPAFYEHLMANEAGEVRSEVLEVIDVVDVYREGKGRVGYSFEHQKDRLLKGTDGGGTVHEIHDDGHGTLHPVHELALPASQAIMHLPDVNASAALSQIPLLDGDRIEKKEELFPPGLYDRDDQQLDLRSENSWTLALGQISSVEMMECHVINAFAPWVLISELKSLMEETGNPDGSSGEWDKFVVNVSAMEGQFYRNKTIFHPHTNMAKASLNMMTRTASAGLAAQNIFMTAVDTGWITDENPAEQWEKRAQAPPPLDEWDACMRVIDPVLMGIRGEEKLWGVFLKNYRATRW
ncbi:hypothetical protein HDV00_000121 [Rhizophlyctis rosea]|nr:hypothetical protein HDV00_000121 [Rhizophlyctis rosea]